MIRIYFGDLAPVANLEWSIYKGMSGVLEDFSNSEVFLWLVGGGNKFLVECTVEDGVIKAVIPRLPVGVYGTRAMWVKDGCCGKRMLAEVQKVFGVTNSLDEATPVAGDSFVIKIKSCAASYGYDGLSAYEMAVLNGKTVLSEQEWMDSQNQASEMYGNLTESIDEIWAAISSIIYGDTVVETSFTPSAAYVDMDNNIRVDVSVNKDVSSIKVFRGDTEIGEGGSGTEYSATDIVHPDDLTPIVYTVKIVFAGMAINKRFSLSVAKREANLSWSKNYDTVNTKEEHHYYPVLNNPQSLPVTYTSSNPSVASIDSSTGAITLHNIAGGVVISAVFAGDDTFNAKTVEYMLTVLSAADYYIGWATGDSSGFDAFAALTAEQLVALSREYSKISNPSITKTITAAEATGTRQIFVVMWRDSSAPVSGSVTSGGITDNLSASDFTNTDVFRATHNDIVVDDVTYHVAGMRGAFDAGDVFVVNF